MGILEILLSLFIFSSPLGAVVRISPFQNVNIYPYDIFALLVFLFVMYRTAVKREKIEGKKLLVLMLLFLGTGFISLLLNFGLETHEFLTSFAYLARYAVYASILFAPQFVSDKFRKKLPLLLIVSGVIFAIFGYIQYFFYPSLRNLYYLGWDEHLYRLFSTALDPNFAGALLVLVFLLIGGKAIDYYEKKSFNLFYILSGFFVAVAILLTYSRSAFIMLLVGFITLLLLYGKTKILLGGVGFLLFLYFIFANPNIEGLNPLRMASAEARIDSAEGAIEIILKNPIIGVGFNAYRYTQYEYGLRSNENVIPSNADAGTDNSYLFVLATTGIIGFLFFADFWLNVIRGLVRTKSKVALASVGAILVNTVFINSIFYPLIISWVFMVVGLTLSRKR